MLDVDETLAACRLYIAEQRRARMPMERIGRTLGLSRQMAVLAQARDWNPTINTVRQIVVGLQDIGWRPAPDALAAEIAAARGERSAPDPNQADLFEGQGA